jgi:hypothetical protein
MPVGSPIVDYLWRLVRENPDVIPQIVRMAKDKFGSTEPPPAQAPPPLDTSIERIEQLESDLASAGRLIGALESRLDAQAQQLARAEAANAQLARRLRTAIIAVAAAFALAFGLLVYLLVR